MEENTKEMIVIDSVDRYNEIFGLETRHPLVSIIDPNPLRGPHVRGFVTKCMHYT